MAFVTGAGGFVGAHVARHLMDEGWDVRALVRPASMAARRWPDGCEVVGGDGRDAATMRRGAEGADAVFHVAADYRLARHAGRRLERDNLAMTRHALDAAGAAGAAMVMTSSVSTIGFRDDRPADETSNVDDDHMVGAYKRSKLATERLALDAAAAGQRVVVVNPTTPIGPGDARPTPTGRVVRDAAMGRMPAVVDTGLNAVDVEDVARGHLQALEHGVSGRRYILGGQNLTLKFIVSVAAETGGHPPPRLQLPHSLAIGISAVDELVEGTLLRREPRAPLNGALMARTRMWVTSGRARRELGYEPGPAEPAIARAARWYLDEAGAVGRAA
ncbi:MAG: NAD-dependent epimerase/dehydratase family protein [Miltoncostaeaceae bacterium]